MKKSKKVLSVLLAVLLAALCVPVAFAAEGTYEDLTWTYDESTKTLTIGGTGEIPSYSSSPWKEYLEEVKAVVIGDGVTKIGNKAFFCCNALKSAVIGNGVHTISEFAFHYSALEGITIPGNVRRIYIDAFYGCKFLESVTIEEGVELIDELAFGKCTVLKTVSIPASVTRIKKEAFFECNALETVNYGGTQEQWDAIEFGEDVFTGCISDGESHYITYPLELTINVQPDETGSEPDDSGVATGKTSLWDLIVSFFKRIGEFFKNLFKK